MRRGSGQHVGHRKAWDGRGVLLDEALAAPGGPRPWNLAELFGNDRPVELEIGSGKGTFLLARAAARPEVNLLGVEVARAYCHYAADRVRRAGLANVRLVRADAVHVVRRCLPAASLLRMHVYFPDPWPKRRHAKRRLIQPAFVAEARRVLRLGGLLLIVTDHWAYFQQIHRVVGAAAGLAAAPMPRMADASGELVGTNFERKYISQGRAFYAVARMRYA